MAGASGENRTQISEILFASPNLIDGGKAGAEFRETFRIDRNRPGGSRGKDSQETRSQSGHEFFSSETHRFLLR
jgi:hypothetical protein